MTSAPPPANRRLIEEWLPINELSIEAIRERAAAVPNPAPHQLLVWWARRPLAPARAAVAASLLRADADHDAFIDAMGTYVGVFADQQSLAAGDGDGYAKRRAFTHNLTAAERAWPHETWPPAIPTRWWLTSRPAVGASLSRLDDSASVPTPTTIIPSPP